MTPGARISAAIECLDQIFAGMPAEKALTGWARRSRFAGSKDRAAVRDHVFDALRSRDTYAHIGGALTGRSVMIGFVQSQDDQNFDDLLNGLGHSPEPLTDAERATLTNVMAPQSHGDREPWLMSANWFWDMQDWCADMLKEAYPETACEIAQNLKARAPLDVRVNTRRSSVSEAIDLLQADEILAQTCDISPSVIRIVQNARKVKLSRAFLEGHIEVQDAGSQALVNALPLSGVARLLDYCAGGGGKSLAIADICDATVFAHDISDARMVDIPVRATRAGVSIQCLSTDKIGQQAPFDLVLCDAPCSGSGAWRRSPDAKWRLTAERFQELLDLQYEILTNARKQVSENGYLAYATCSLFAQENEDQVNRFLKEFPMFEKKSQSSWTPLDGCDGFFICVMQLKG